MVRFPLKMENRMDPLIGKKGLPRNQIYCMSKEMIENQHMNRVVVTQPCLLEIPWLWFKRGN